MSIKIHLVNLWASVSSSYFHFSNKDFFPESENVWIQVSGRIERNNKSSAAGTGQKGEGLGLEAGQSYLINGLDHPANECFEIEFDYL